MLYRSRDAFMSIFKHAVSYCLTKSVYPLKVSRKGDTEFQSTFSTNDQFKPMSNAHRVLLVPLMNLRALSEMNAVMTQ